MKKRLLRAAVALLLCASFLILLVSCSEKDELEKKAKKYLENKYGALKFELVDYTQNKTTNGWYVAHIKCKNDSTVFTMFISSVMMTDSYSVDKANADIEKMLFDGPFAEYKDQIENVEAINVFEDGFDDYKFRSVDLDAKTDLSDIGSIYRVYISDDVDTVSKKAGLIYDLILSLEPYGIKLGKSTFVFDYKGCRYIIEAGYDSATDHLREDFIQIIYEQYLAESEKLISAGKITFDFDSIENK